MTKLNEKQQLLYNFIKDIRETRRAKFMTQGDLVAKVHYIDERGNKRTMSIGYLQGIESGRLDYIPKTRILKPLCKVIGLNFQDYLPTKSYKEMKQNDLQPILEDFLAQGNALLVAVKNSQHNGRVRHAKSA